MALPRPCTGALFCKGCLSYQGPVVEPRQCVAVGGCLTKAMQWGLSSVLQWVGVQPRPCSGARGPGAVYCRVRDDAFAPPVVLLTRLHGRAMANARERDGLLPEVWGPINRKYAEAPEPCLEAFIAKYGRHMCKVSMLASKLKGELLCKRRRAMSPSSMGLEGWCMHDLWSLPDWALHWRAKLLQLVEDARQLPGVLAKGYTSLIPKPGEEGSLGTRPLTVSSMVYRLWAGDQLWDVPHWKDAWLHAEASSFRPRWGGVDGAGVTAVTLQLVRPKGWNLRPPPRLCQML